MFISGRFRLRAVEKSDLLFLKELRDDPETSEYLMTRVFISEHSQTAWLEKTSADNSRKYLMFDYMENSTWTTIGLVRLTEMDYINRTVNVGGDVHPCFRGRGYGKEMYRLIFNLMFDVYNFHRVWLSVLSFNKRAIALYEKMGFVHEGCLREACYRNGNYHDCYIMSRLQHEQKA